MNIKEKVLIIFICCILLIHLIIFSLHSRVMDRKFRGLQDRVEAIEKGQRYHKNIQDGVLNWMKAVQIQDCDTLPSCDKSDEMWLKGKIKCVHCGRWIKERKPCPHQEKEDLEDLLYIVREMWVQILPGELACEPLLSGLTGVYDTLTIP